MVELQSESMDIYHSPSNDQAELSARLDYLWQSRAQSEQRERHELKEGSRRIVFNILPAHVAIHFLLNRFKGKV